MNKVFGLGIKLYILILFVVLIALGFYWFQWKPGEARKGCANEATRGSAFSRSSQNNKYRLCLTKQGMKPESLFVTQ